LNHQSFERITIKPSMNFEEKRIASLKLYSTVLW